jgi:Cu+-exporting ATPase
MHTESCQHDHDHDHSHPHEQPDGSQRDLVCGMTVPLDSRYFELYEGRTYRFCSEKCLTKFRAAPVRYLSPPQDQEHAGHLHSAAPQPATRRTPNTLARCIPKSASVGRAAAQSVAWP